MAGIQRADAAVDGTVAGTEETVASSGTPTKYLLVSSFDCFLQTCDYENAVLRYDGVTGAYLDRHIPSIAAPYGMALHPRRETILVVSKTAHAVDEFNARTGAFIRRFITAGAEGLHTPQQIIFNSADDLLVTSTQSEGNITKFNGILKFDGDTGAFMSQFVNGGSVFFDNCAAANCLRAPNSMVFGPTGNLYVVSTVNDMVIEYGPTGAYIGAFIDATKLTGPVGLAIRPANALRPGNLHVTTTYPPTNNFDGVVLEFDKTFRALVGTNGGVFANSLVRPSVLDWGSDGTLLVAERTGELAPIFADRITRKHRDTGAAVSSFTATNDNKIHLATGMLQVAFNYATDDNDGDGDVDLQDLAAMQRCFGRLSPGSSCLTPFDDNLSGRIGDGDYFAFFQRLRGPRRPCTNNSQCDDDNPCTGDTCVSSVCTFSKLADGTPCPDGLFCTGTTDFCSGGACTGTRPCVSNAHCDEANDRCFACAVNSECNDNNPCTNDVCVPATGCQHSNNTAACDDGNACTVTDQCSNGSCQAGSARVCNDGNICTNDSCDPQFGCLFTNNNVACNDGNLCTFGDQCFGGSCSLGQQATCNDNNICTTDSCSPTLGCRFTNNISACSDNNPCTVNDACSGGTCRSGPPADCNDGVFCTQDTCSGGICSHTPRNDLCDDGIVCNGNETCHHLQGCLPGTNGVTCTASDQCHNVGTCDPSTGACSNPAKPNGTTCNDGNLCTTGDTCQSGICTGTAVVCTATSQCHNPGTCNTSNGVCSASTPKPNGSACDDGSLCTQTDTCQAGSCTGGNPVVCTAQDQCHDAGTCNTGTGVCTNPSKPNGTLCNDANLCTQLDTCQGGTCTGASPVVCTPLDQCHIAGTCNPATGTCSNPNSANGTPCNDGSLCTQSDTCQTGTCTGANPVVCTALDQCHVAGACNPATGQCSDPNSPNGTTCTDGNACTQTDTCQDGSCVGGNSVVCNPLDQCHQAGTCNTSTGICSNPNAPNGTPCGDSSACTQTDTCQNGTCVGGNNVVCSPSDQCHVAGVCNPTTGVCSDPAAPNGTTCNDNDECTLDDACQGGSCVGDEVECVASDQCHEAGVCDSVTGECSDPESLNGTGCDDGDECTLTDTCQSGTCVGDNAVVCSAPDDCHDAGVCNPLTGLCSAPAPLTGTPCDDNDECTQTDVCENGVCLGGNDVICTPSDQCHDAGECDPLSGDCSDPESLNGTGCNDGNLCTLNDTCQGGLCTSSGNVVCSASDQCHNPGTCDPVTGVCSNPAKPNGTTCDDGNACTQANTCQAGSCVGGSNVVCSASDQCHDAGVCDAGTGVCSNPTKPDGTTCNDNNACTTIDACSSGACQGSSAPNCNDGNFCTTDSCNPATGCVNANNTNVCTDDEFCTFSDTCANGVCTGTHRPDGTACDDSDACTQTDTCQAGVCTGETDICGACCDHSQAGGTCTDNVLSGDCTGDSTFHLNQSCLEVETAGDCEEN